MLCGLLGLKILEEAHDYKPRPFFTNPSCLSCKCSNDSILRMLLAESESLLTPSALILEKSEGMAVGAIFVLDSV